MDGNLLVPNSSKVTERLLGVYLVVLIVLFTYLDRILASGCAGEQASGRLWACGVVLCVRALRQVNAWLVELLVASWPAGGGCRHAGSAAVGGRELRSCDGGTCCARSSAWHWRWYSIFIMHGGACWWAVRCGGLQSLWNRGGSRAGGHLLEAGDGPARREVLSQICLAGGTGEGDDERRNKLRGAVPVTDRMVPLRKCGGWCWRPTRPSAMSSPSAISTRSVRDSE